MKTCYLSPFYLFLLVGLLLCSCNAVLTKLYGIKKIEKFDVTQYDKTLKLFVSKYDSSLCVSYIGTESEFMEYRSIDEENKKNLSQPIQILYFSDDTLKSFHVNCYAKGNLFGKLDWNYNKQFSTYYPTSAIESLIENNTMKLSNLSSIYNINKLDNRACIVFFWTNFMKKQCLIAFDTVVENITKNVRDKNDYPLIILINNDHSFIGLE